MTCLVQKLGRLAILGSAAIVLLGKPLPTAAEINLNPWFYPNWKSGHPAAATNPDDPPPQMSDAGSDNAAPVSQPAPTRQGCDFASADRQADGLRWQRDDDRSSPCSGRPAGHTGINRQPQQFELRIAGPRPATDVDAAGVLSNSNGSCDRCINSITDKPKWLRPRLRFASIANAGGQLAVGDGPRKYNSRKRDVQWRDARRFCARHDVVADGRAQQQIHASSAAGRRAHAGSWSQWSLHRRRNHRPRCAARWQCLRWRNDGARAHDDGTRRRRLCQSILQRLLWRTRGELQLLQFRLGPLGQLVWVLRRYVQRRIVR